MLQRLKPAAIALIVLFVVSLLLTAGLSYDYISRFDQIERDAFEDAQTQATAAAGEISSAFGELMTIAEELAADLGDGTVAYEDIESHLLAITTERPDIDGIAVTFEPFVYDSETRLFQTYVYQTEDGSFDVLVGATYDYTVPPGESENATGWYYNTINQGAQWLEPFFATGAGEILVEYGVPFYPIGSDGTDADPAGIVTIDYTLEDVRGLIQALDTGATGYGFVISGEGTFLTHPIREFAVNRSIFDITDGNEALNRTAANAINGNRDFIETVDPITQQTTWYFFEPIGLTGWTVGMVLVRDQFFPDPQSIFRDQMTIALAAALSVFLAATTVFQFDRFHFTNFWWVSATFSFLCVVLIVLTWSLTNQIDRRAGIHINSPAELDRYTQSIQSVANQPDTMIEIPTGIFVQALYFPNPTSVTVNGYIWQRYSTDADIERGFALPQRTGEEVTIEEVEREIIDGEEVIVWYVGVTLRQIYETDRFPFDHRTISVRITPLDLDGHILLTPDFEAYDLINPGVLPGVDTGVDINNWTLQTSGYSYTDDRINTDFGLSSRENNGSIPELRFEIQAQRIYLGPFIAYLLPGMIAAMMTFAYLMSGRRVGDNDEIVSALNYAAALFFVVAVIHTALRDQIAAVEITYMEHLYILLYLAIIAVAANVFVVARFPDWLIVRYRDNLLPKVLYWPVFAGGMLLSTLLVFVY